MKKSYLVRALSKEPALRGLVCVTTGLVDEARHLHETSPVATAALGHGLTAAALLGALLKVQQRVALKVEGDGPLQKMVVESDSYGHIRGYVAVPDVALPPPFDGAAVVQALGRQGVLTVVKDLQLKHLYEGVVPLQGGELDQELAHYFAQSEQIPSLVEIGVRVDEAGEVVAAGGLLIQPMPEQDPGVLEAVANRLDDLPPVEDCLAAGDTPESLLATLFGPIEYEILETRDLEYRCTCSWERSRKALLALGRDELKSLMQEGQAVIDCHFCHQQYVFGPEELETILEELEAQ